jgi:hypothetical protein
MSLAVSRVEIYFIVLADYLTLGGPELEIGCPDFIVSKVIPTPVGEPMHRMTLAVIEIRKSDADRQSSLRQLVRYSTTMKNMADSVCADNEAFPAYLLYEDMFTWLEIRPGPDGEPELKPQPWQSIFQHSDPAIAKSLFIYKMCELAVQYWNL